MAKGMTASHVPVPNNQVSSDGTIQPVTSEGQTDESTVTAEIEPHIWLDLDEALESLHEAMPDYLTAEAYYEGTVREKFVNRMVEKLLSGSETDFNVNLAGRVVDAVKDRMEIAAVTAEPVGTEDSLALDEDPEDDEFEDEDELNNETRDNSSNAGSGSFGGVEDSEDEMSDEEKELDRAISKIWRDNEMDIESPEIHEKMLEYGDSYLFVGLSDDEDEAGDKVDLFYNSPLNVRVLYDDENPRKKRLAIKRWEVGPKNNRRIRLNLYYTDGTYKFLSTGSTDKGGAASYTPFTDESTDLRGFVANDTGEIPFFHFRTARPYGRPEHKKAYGAQDALTKFIVNMMDNTDFSTFPQRYALKESGTTTDDDLDWDGGNSDTADTRNPSDLESQLVSGPGRIWTLNNVKAVGQFDTADIEQFLKPIDKFTGLMAAVTATPISYFLVTLSSNASASSGESQRKGESPFISKVNARQLSAEATWSDSLAYALKLRGYDAEAKVRWAPSQVVSGVDGWRAVQEQQKAGVPVRQTLLEAGYTEAEVSSWGYTEENPDGPGLDMSDQMFPPPIPGQPMPTNLPGAMVSEEIPTPPPVTGQPVTGQPATTQPVV